VEALHQQPGSEEKNRTPPFLQGKKDHGNLVGPTGGKAGKEKKKPGVPELPTVEREGGVKLRDNKRIILRKKREKETGQVVPRGKEGSRLRREKKEEGCKKFRGGIVKHACEEGA